LIRIGEEGSANVSFTVLRDGSVGDLVVSESSAPAFGQACVNMLRNTSWKPATDRSGQTTDYPLTFHCLFEIDPAPRVSPSAYQPQPPSPPGNLDRRLREYYPVEMIRIGEEGSAKVRLTVLRDGSVGNLVVSESSAPAFGQACVNMLRNTLWKPATDRSGQTTDFPTTFNCAFEIDDSGPSLRYLVATADSSLKETARQALRECKNQARADAGAPEVARQDWSLRIHFAANGVVVTAEPAQGIASDPVMRCLIDLANAWRFPQTFRRDTTLVIALP
jgi:TonB family protein